MDYSPASDKVPGLVLMVLLAGKARGTQNRGSDGVFFPEEKVSRPPRVGAVEAASVASLFDVGSHMIMLSDLSS